MFEVVNHECLFINQSNRYHFQTCNYYKLLITIFSWIFLISEHNKIIKSHIFQPSSKLIFKFTNKCNEYCAIVFIHHKSIKELKTSF